MHCDTFMVITDTDKNLKENDCMVDLQKMQKGDYLLQCFAMYVPYYSKTNEPNYSPFVLCHRMIDRYYAEIEKYPDLIAPVFSSKDIEENIRKNKMSALLTIEEGGVCLGHIELLRNFFRLGVRMMTLTWNFKNEIASPNIELTNLKPGEVPSPYPNTTDGLTPFGIEVVREMNRLGMVIDCSHLGDAGFYDVIKYSTKPIVCSHSCTRALAHSTRNMTDDMLLKLKENGGVVGINYARGFVKDDRSDATVEDIVQHINHVRDLIGIDYVGLGTDFDGIDNRDIELKDASMMPLLIKELEKEGYSEEEIDKICYKNVLRVFKANF